MTIQNLPAFFDMEFTKEGGRLSSDGYLYLDQQFQALNYTVFATNATVSSYVQKSNENPFGLSPIPEPRQLVILGINPPSYTTTQINTISIAVDSNGNFLVPLGTMWYDTDINKLKVLVDVATVRTVQTITSA